jgi:hypothetical protein
MRVARTLAPLAAAALLLAAPAAAGTRITGIDASRYPLVTLSVVTSTPVAAAPRLTENGLAARGASALNLGRAKSVVLAIDRSQSMAGASFHDAIAAAQTFVASKLPGDQIAVVAFGHSAETLSGFSNASSDADSALAGHVDRPRVRHGSVRRGRELGGFAARGARRARDHRLDRRARRLERVDARGCRQRSAARARFGLRSRDREP